MRSASRVAVVVPSGAVLDAAVPTVAVLATPTERREEAVEHIAI
jgi:hypothetical protein